MGSDIFTLADVPVGACVRIVCVRAQGALRERLHNHGFIENNTVEVVRRAPFGEVRVYRVMHTLVALRKKTAAHILVKEKEKEW